MYCWFVPHFHALWKREWTRLFFSFYSCLYKFCLFLLGKLWPGFRAGLVSPASLQNSWGNSNSRSESAHLCCVLCQGFKSQDTLNQAHLITSHSNVDYIKMYLWPLACRSRGDLAVLIPFPPQGRGRTWCHSSYGCFPAREQWGTVESSHEISCRGLSS